MVEYMDQCVGGLIEHVDRLGIAEKTVIIFYSDNGTHRAITSQTVNGPVVGGKGFPTDAGTHVPLIVRWKGTIQPGINGDLIDSTDFVPTCLEIAGRSVGDIANLDGVSFYPQLMGTSVTARKWIFSHYDPRPGWDKDQFDHLRTVRNHRFKLYSDGSFYDLQNDPGETNNLRSGELTISEAGRRALDEFQMVLARMPDPEPPARDELKFAATGQNKIVPQDADLELLWERGQFTEGPVAAPDGTILFSDVRASRIYRFDPATKRVGVFLENTGKANGLEFDRNGNLVMCQGADDGARAISIVKFDGQDAEQRQPQVLVDRWQGKRLNSPNDLAIAPNGDIYFTDPRYVGEEPRELSSESVYMIRKGKVIRATKSTMRPNGIVISKDGRYAFVADHDNRYGGDRKLYRFEINRDGTFGKRTELFDFGFGRRGIDGMCLGPEGNIYATAGRGTNSGVYVFGQRGEQLAVIRVPGDPTNCTFGGPDNPRMLYITAQVPQAKGASPFGLYRIDLSKD